MPPDLVFDAWWEELNYIASERGLLHLLSANRQDHYASWSEGNSPEDELDNQHNQFT